MLDHAASNKLQCIYARLNNITTTSLPPGQVGTAYSATLTATGGSTPYQWALTSGTLPAGLSLNPTAGTISGTPTTSIAAPLTFKVTDSGNPALSNTANFTLTIAPATLRVTSTSLPTGQVGTPYSATLGASGGTLPYSWSITNGTLPAGLTLIASGAMTGTPTASRTSSLTLQVTDSGSPAQTSTVTLSLTIAPATLRITTASLPGGLVGVPYSASLVAKGGNYAVRLVAHQRQDRKSVV